MRILTLALAGLATLSFVSLTAEPVQAVGLCVDESGHNGNTDLYNNMGPQPTADCDGVFCYGYSGNGNWNSCVPPTIYCTTLAPCPPPIAVGTSLCDLGVCPEPCTCDPPTVPIEIRPIGEIIGNPCERLMCQPPMDP